MPVVRGAVGDVPCIPRNTTAGQTPGCDSSQQTLVSAGVDNIPRMISTVHINWCLVAMLPIDSYDNNNNHHESL